MCTLLRIWRLCGIACLPYVVSLGNGSQDVFLLVSGSVCMALCGVMPEPRYMLIVFKEYGFVIYLNYVVSTQ